MKWTSGYIICVSPTSELVTIVAIGLQKHYAKSESGTNLVMYDVFLLATKMLFMGSKYLEYISSVTVMHNDNNNRT
jgi:hypothetical protein